LAAGGLLLLGLVPDEVDFGLAGCRGSGLLDVDLCLFFLFLGEHVDEGLLFVLLGQLDLGTLGRGGSGGLDEDDLVVFTGLGWSDDPGRPLLLRLFGCYVNVDVLAYDRSLEQRISHYLRMPGVRTTVNRSRKRVWIKQ